MSIEFDAFQAVPLPCGGALSGISVQVDEGGLATLVAAGMTTAWRTPATYGFGDHRYGISRIFFAPGTAWL
jgi:hypothetical protein